VWRGPGAIDNATGVEGLVRVAALLAGRRHPRSLAFVAFGAEEIGLLGAKHYVAEAKSRAELGRIVGMVNLDCIGHGEKLELLVSPEQLMGRVHELAHGLGLLDRYEVETTIGDEAGTDHLPFAQAAIPAASNLHYPYDEYHLPADTEALVDPQRLADAVNLAVALVESQLAEPVPKPS
jgi:aminopeptidase YwaD